MMRATEDLLNNIQTFQPLKMAVITPPGQPVCCKVSDVVPVQHYHHTASCIIHPVKGRDNWTHAAGFFLLGSFQDTFGGDIALYKQKWMDSSGIRIPTPTGDTRWGSSGGSRLITRWDSWTFVHLAAENWALLSRNPASNSHYKYKHKDLLLPHHRNVHTVGGRHRYEGDPASHEGRGFLQEEEKKGSGVKSCF